jgi:hypothetical protein
MVISVLLDTYLAFNADQGGSGTETLIIRQ